MLLLPQQSLLMTLSGLRQLTIQLSKLLVSSRQDLATPDLFHFGLCSNMRRLLHRQCRLLGHGYAPLMCKAAVNLWHAAATDKSCLMSGTAGRKKVELQCNARCMLLSDMSL